MQSGPYQREAFWAYTYEYVYIYIHVHAHIYIYRAIWPAAFGWVPKIIFVVGKRKFASNTQTQRQTHTHTRMHAETDR